MLWLGAAWTAIKGFFGGGSIMLYVYIAAAAFVGLLLWRNHSLGAERDHALEQVGALQIINKQHEANEAFAKLRVQEFVDSAKLYQQAVADFSNVSYNAHGEWRKIDVAFTRYDHVAAAKRNKVALEGRIDLGWARLNCLLVNGTGGLQSCPVGPSIAGEEASPTGAAPR